MSTRILRNAFALPRNARRKAPSPARIAYRKARQRVRLAQVLIAGTHGVDDDYALRILTNLGARHPRTCPVCGFVGKFLPYGLPPRKEAQCPYCGSLERHRLLAHVDRTHGILTTAKAMLHFAPEPLLSDVLRHACPQYTSADLMDPSADLKLDIEHLEVPDEAFDTVLCSHVLEHVDDRKALSELHRVLTPDGRLIAMVPLAEGCRATYENPEVRDPLGRTVHFGQWDHVRVYGADFRDRVREAGFRVREFTAEGEDAVHYGFMMGEKVFVCEKT